MRRPRRLALAATALGLSVLASGCAYFSPVQTQDFYQTADGTNANISDESGNFESGVRNMILVVQPDGSAVLRGSVVNYTEESIAVDIEVSADGSPVLSAQVPVPAGDAVELGPDTGQQLVEAASVPAEPGDVIDLEMVVDGESAGNVLPVTDTTLEYYGDNGSSDGGGAGASDGGGAGPSDGGGED